MLVRDAAHPLRMAHTGHTGRLRTASESSCPFVGDIPSIGRRCPVAEKREQISQYEYLIDELLQVFFRVFRRLTVTNSTTSSDDGAAAESVGDLGKNRD
jgi:hypothetical protein